eukprot:6522969-Prymnesium_polylepis.1
MGAQNSSRRATIVTSRVAIFSSHTAHKNSCGDARRIAAHAATCSSGDFRSRSEHRYAHLQDILVRPN